MARRRPGKYAHVINALPRLLGAEPAYQQKVEAVKEAMKKEPGFLHRASDLVHKYVMLRIEKEQIEAASYDVNLRTEAVKQLMAEQFEVESVSTMKTSEGISVSTHLEPYARVENAALLQEWALADPDLRRKLALPWMTVNGITKERLLAGEPEPPGVSIYAITRVRIGSE